MSKRTNEEGFTIIDLVVGISIMSIVAVGALSLFVSLVNSSISAKQMSIGLTLATNQMEYLKSLPYDNLAVQGGSIYSTSPLPAEKNETVDGMTYTIRTSISYVDEAYDGCANYPNQTLKETYCRNYPPHSSAPTVDTNPQDYKIAHVEVFNNTGKKRGEVDTQISSRVSETNSTTGALFISVVDDNGNPVSGATVGINNSTLAPVINLSDSTDGNGIAIFYGLPPDATGSDYVITASKSNYSTLVTIDPSGSLQPNYSNQNVLAQQSSYLTMVIKPQGQHSLVAEVTDTSGNPLSNARIYTKGGYKRFTSSSDTQYYYDNISPTDTRPTSDASGMITYSNLVPGQYIFCGDLGATSCTIGGTTYYLAAAIPYSGANSLNPINVPIYDPFNPPSTTFPYGGNSYLQQVRLMLTSNSNFPRINNFTPYDVSLSSSSLNNFEFQVQGANLPCSSNPASCSTSIQFTQASSTYAASCSGTDGSNLDCTVDLTGIVSGSAQMSISANGYTLALPSSPLLGGLIVNP